MFQHTSTKFKTQIVEIPVSDRWRIRHRLQELMIPSWCPADGSLVVEIDSAIAAILVRSTVQQFVATRQELLSWLERCWTAEVIS
ncbi:Asr1405/Asl0597 family protein [Gloeocapsa sp. BRSZ]